MPEGFRVGLGHDTHRLVAGKPLILGGVTIPHDLGLAGHSDADIVLHALTDALLGAAGLGDIGELFPDTDSRWAGAASQIFVREAVRLLAASDWRVGNVDVIIHAEKPKLSTHKLAIRDQVAILLEIQPDRVNIKAKTGEKVGPVGRGEAMECHVVALIESKKNTA
ncbi:MAG: 2-C-methyl-D-erythritol 2,4-cyclodiphosphate synthase [Gemmataceae bacterium]